VLELASTARAVQHSGIREIVNMVIGRPPGEVVRLEIGEPGFSTPQHIVAAGATAAATARYAPSAGHMVLREALVRRMARVTGVDVAPEQIIVTQGGVQACALTMSALLAPGDEVLVPDPAWPNYEMIVDLLGGRAVRYPLPAADGFVPDPDDIVARMTDRTKVLVLNSPGNPTGAVFPRDVVRRLVDAAAARGIVVLSDEVYDELIFEGEAAAAITMDDQHVVAVHSFSKTYAMTGWRVGWAVAPTWLAPTMAKLQEPMLSCIPDLTSAGALAALDGPQDAIATMREAYRARRDLCVDLITGAGIEVAVPRGAFYLMVPLAGGVDSRQAAIDLVGHGVSVAPGTAFGAAAADHVRISLASEEPELREGIRRLTDWYAATEGGSRR
jgi:aspartate/methionine/tyrosine aminotransferase